MNKLFAWAFVASTLCIFFAWGAAQTEVAYSVERGQYFFARR